MTEISRKAAFGKLNSLAYKAIEGATVFCKLRGNPYVELVHWVAQILQTQDSDLQRIVKHFELDSSRLAKDITDSLDRLPRGASSISDLSSQLDDAGQRGWVYATLMFGDTSIRTGHLLVGTLKTPSLRNALMAISRQFEKINLDTLTAEFARLLADSPEAKLAASSAGAAPGEASDAIAPAVLGKQEALKRYATDLTERARKGQIDPISGRDEEIRQIVDILMRRRQNNPILTGEAANLLKPALARGTLRTIAATTWAEYKKHIEKDPALTRRFQVVQVAEPSEEKAILMVRGVASVLEKHHRVQVLDQALEAAVRLSHRYI